MNTAGGVTEQRTTQEWSKLARETVAVENIGGTRYAYGSELACLRLAYQFRGSGDRAAAGYSENRKTWYFRLEPHHA